MQLFSYMLCKNTQFIQQKQETNEAKKGTMCVSSDALIVV